MNVILNGNPVVVSHVEVIAILSMDGVGWQRLWGHTLEAKVEDIHIEIRKVAGGA